MIDKIKPFNPRVTVFTNYMLDHIMPELSGNAWKVLCLAMRKTQGWHDASSPTGRKIEDVISLSQFTDYCGISKPTAVDAIEECISKGYLIRRPEGQSFSYWLNVEFDPDTCKETLQPDMGGCKETLQDTCKETLHTNNNLINNKEHSVTSKKEEVTHVRLTAEDYKTQTMKSLQAYARRQESGEVDFGWLGEGLIHLARAFVRACGVEYAPTRGERAHWRKVLLEWQEIGFTDDIIARTVQKMKTQGLNISGVQSITGMARSVMTSQGKDNLPPEFHSTEEQVKAYKEQFGI